MSAGDPSPVPQPGDPIPDPPSPLPEPPDPTGPPGPAEPQPPIPQPGPLPQALSSVGSERRSAPVSADCGSMPRSVTCSATR